MHRLIFASSVFELLDVGGGLWIFFRQCRRAIETCRYEGLALVMSVEGISEGEVAFADEKDAIAGVERDGGVGVVLLGAGSFLFAFIFVVVVLRLGGLLVGSAG